VFCNTLLADDCASWSSTRTSRLARRNGLKLAIYQNDRTARDRKVAATPIGSAAPFGETPPEHDERRTPTSHYMPDVSFIRLRNHELGADALADA